MKLILKIYKFGVDKKAGLFCTSKPASKANFQSSTPHTTHTWYPELGEPQHTHSENYSKYHQERSRLKVLSFMNGLMA